MRLGEYVLVRIMSSMTSACLVCAVWVMVGLHSGIVIPPSSPFQENLLKAGWNSRNFADFSTDF